mmetsp:Transcript_26289/g.32836  ORF Transcript_26289/g.32836 Transcript_26289/m.32836 type:complete len:151 (-) Transcript_26289:284-736(-)|eukprot:CAMPEP_0117756880 /NCGR_PEP_ID=MMETSP0947-20121206/14368_1 /TAXON_ID=44440 /ORGANISM="Chattonella subsalsa, Strain CCMP2191" /LENGTH=150 /DNA_ID=CAMNT_0005576605 /DNA_START=216 /DNA_END=668 /DNA_ORIENTATION=-
MHIIKSTRNQKSIHNFVAVPVAPELIQSQDGPMLMEEETQQQPKNNNSIEKLWKLQRKALLRIGSKGVHQSHINSLKELLLAHSVIKVKVNDLRAEMKVTAIELLGEEQSFGQILDIKGKHILYASNDFMKELETDNEHLIDVENEEMWQ